ncbi:acyclic terpene utilization AtuA family protein [Sedimentibacter sp. MB31-C6]|uniref:acyclic terpene utilization AtuA family protein n=1 Tax=Sedimentibacter sp. MB31-C6 TaxID=3109366 RepID=UPI002DDD5165|nr:acyclic terpene utilization AtuA family protein [Sedimentibacter sp. MB36-C1]WSI03575.1 acyclic terpene utilization AtuA family protein [Sedimentibacter sp. MB36-C1]
MKKIRIGSGAGYAGDRLEPALELIEKGNIDYISFECLAERTIAIAQKAKLVNPNKGYNGLLEHRMDKVLPLAYKHKVKVITNMGAANPQSAADVVCKMAEEKGIKGLKVAAVYGDDVLDKLDKYKDTTVWETGKPLSELDGIISANVYMGIDGIVEALKNGADIVITGRVSDPALFLAPLVYEFGWDLNNYDLLGKGTLIGHLLECGGQATGGYYAEPGKKDVEKLWELGFPIAEVSEGGEFIMTKVEGSGGVVNKDTLTEQMIYEIHDPSTYLTPDCIADFSKVTFTQKYKDVVEVKGATGREKTDTLKVSLGYKDCYIGEGEISYAGPGCLERAKLAAEIVEKRLKLTNVNYDELRVDFIGINAIYKNSERNYNTPEEVRLRVAARTKNKNDAVQIGNEVETLYTNGPAGGGGATKTVNEIVSVASILVNRNDVEAKVIYKEVQ